MVKTSINITLENKSRANEYKKKTGADLKDLINIAIDDFLRQRGF